MSEVLKSKFEEEINSLKEQGEKVSNYLKSEEYFAKQGEILEKADNNYRKAENLKEKRVCGIKVDDYKKVKSIFKKQDICQGVQIASMIGVAGSVVAKVLTQEMGIDVSPVFDTACTATLIASIGAFAGANVGIDKSLKDSDNLREKVIEDRNKFEYELSANYVENYKDHLIKGPVGELCGINQKLYGDDAINQTVNDEYTLITNDAIKKYFENEKLQENETPEIENHTLEGLCQE